MKTVEPPNGHEFVASLKALQRFLNSSDDIFPATREDIEKGLMIAMAGALRWAAEDAMFAEQHPEQKRKYAN
jgi:hypothetical protein